MPSDQLVELEPASLPEDGDNEERPPGEPLQDLTKALAFDATRWNSEVANQIRERFDARASEWTATRDTPESRFPLIDALARGEVPRGGLCLEIGSGTGIQTPALAGHFDAVVSLDLSLEMLRNAPAAPGRRVRADASRLPIAPGSAAAIVCVNAFLFAAQYAATLTLGGVVIFASTRGAATPIYLAPDAVLDALRAEDPRFEGVTARVGRGCWTVVRRA